MKHTRHVFIISDLHIGGEYPKTSPEGTESRGFRMMNHAPDLVRFISLLADRPADGTAIELVINGDFVDFLAEPVGEKDPAKWIPFRDDPIQARDAFRALVKRDQLIFDELARLLHNGHTLTILLGNHDIELSLPSVRKVLEETLEVSGRHRLRFLYDNEGYKVGDALIEHGNRYDIFNWVDHDLLRQFRSVQSRGMKPAEYAVRFPPIVGSQLVTEVMNPLKVDYPFVDLLKPEREAVLPLLRILMGGYMGQLGRILKAARILAPVVRRRLKKVHPNLKGAIAAQGAPSSPIGERVAAFLAALGDLDHLPGQLGNIAAPALSVGLERAQPAPPDEVLRKNLPKLLEALQILKDDMSFSDTIETQTSYLDAAEELSSSGEFRYVIFGHTHLAKKVRLKTGALYLNSGTWAGLMQIPESIFAGTEAARQELERFVKGIRDNKFQDWIQYRPTFIRLCLGQNDKVTQADLLDFKRSGPFDPPEQVVQDF
ncbi:MAG: metallophosphoesterase [Polyangia bacterium]